MILKLICFLSIGRLTIFTLQKFPFRKLSKTFLEGKFLGDLIACDLCLGVWVFMFLSFIFGIDLIQWILGDGVGLIVINQVLTGAIASFVVHVFKVGWTTEFGITILE